jgi:hypothetical protein
MLMAHHRPCPHTQRQTHSRHHASPQPSSCTTRQHANKQIRSTRQHLQTRLHSAAAVLHTAKPLLSSRLATAKWSGAAPANFSMCDHRSHAFPNCCCRCACAAATVAVASNCQLAMCCVLLRAVSPERLLHCLSLLVSKLLRLTVRRLQDRQVMGKAQARVTQAQM